MAFEELTIGVILVAALLDSINPCVFGVLIFLIAFMFAVFKTPNRMLLGGILYTAVVYLTYFLIGIGFIKFTVGLGISVAVYWTAAGVAILAGFLEVKDYFWYGKGFTLQLLPGSVERLKFFTKKIAAYNKKHPRSTYFLAAILGVFVTLVELPCTGAPYLAILALIAQGFQAQAVPLLLLYNLIFVLPLFVIIGLAYFGKSSTILERWRMKHRGTMRLVIGLFLIALGTWLIFSIGTFT